MQVQTAISQQVNRTAISLNSLIDIDITLYVYQNSRGSTGRFDLLVDIECAANHQRNITGSGNTIQSVYRADGGCGRLLNENITGGRVGSHRVNSQVKIPCSRRTDAGCGPQGQCIRGDVCGFSCGIIKNLTAGCCNLNFATCIHIREQNMNGRIEVNRTVTTAGDLGASIGHDDQTS
ncbi:hypothetical protein V6x_13220 [Gimesia chilikensis]|uniref:Uncharacterized protein n=1 Tax=Gimesia chilikensis TaxID=2605989 RepID=A0A517W8Q3_9PLAN|nr:hypothetical protein V6x_13220 [Gimesia chilikensis]